MSSQSFFSKHLFKILGGAAALGIGYFAYKALSSENYDFGVPFELLNDDRKDLLLSTYGNPQSDNTAIILGANP